ncbi:S-protein homolog 5-like [Rhododendron vialii]|uniref:S-protein homolog 5-like n=1 Tax=Rhododendron vialii TaxID=182163 RepID=UPI00265D8430|nr:S-protein homolog 5-like [Rhododendron vialii]
MSRPLFLLFVALTFHFVYARTYHEAIHIISRVPNNPSPLRVRCQSKDTDFGMHTLYEGQEFVWFFNRALTTLYFCHFYWGSKDRSFAVYDLRIFVNYCAYEDDKDHCKWEARPNVGSNAMHVNLASWCRLVGLITF